MAWGNINIDINNATDIGAISIEEKGVAGGIATLGEDGLVPTSQLPEMGAVKSVNGQTGEIELYTYGTEMLVTGESPLADGIIYYQYK